MSLEFAFEAIPEGKGAPTRFLLVNDGEMDWDGDDLIFDKAAGETVIAAFEAQGNQLPIDYHHRTLDAEDEGSTQEAPAAGWIKALEWVDGKGLYAAEVEWTDKAQGQIEAREFKYWSPVLHASKKTGKWTDLHSVALTNRPRTQRMSELLLAAERVSARMETKMAENTDTDVGQEDAPESDVLVAKLREKLGLDADATLEAVLLAALDAMGPDADDEGAESDAAEAAKAEAEKACLAKLAEDLKCDATSKSVSTAIAALQVKAGKLDAMEADVASLKEAEATRVETEAVAASKKLVDVQVEAGRLLPDDKVTMAAAHKLAKDDPESFTALMGQTPPIADPTRHTVQGGARSDRGKMIQAASRKFATRPDYVKKCGVEHYVGAALEEDGQTALTDSERKALTTKEAK